MKGFFERATTIQQKRRLRESTDLPDALSAGDSAADMQRPEKFTESGFSEHVIALCEEGRHELAARYLIENLPALVKSGVNLKEKLNHVLYLPRFVQAGASAKHGYQKTLRKARGVENAIAGYELPLSGGFVELGCGAHDPSALSLYFFLNGFEPCYAIDLLPLRNAAYSAVSMYDLIANVRSFPRRYVRNGTDVKHLVARLRFFDHAAFEVGDYWGGLEKARGAIRLENKDLLKVDIAPASIALTASFAVLEHVEDIDAICKRLFEITMPGGLVYHFVDLADHRVYRGDASFHALTFLTEKEAPRNLNRLRAPEVTAAHERTGFEILKDQRTAIDLPQAIREQLQPRFRDMPVEDLSTIKQHLLLRRPLD